MNIEEYKEEVKKAKERHKRELHAIACKHANSINKLTTGDLISNGTSRIKVEKIRLGYTANGSPVPVYEGQALRTNLEPYKNPKIGVIYFSNDVIKIG